MESVSFEWDVGKAEANYRKHRVRFSECLPVFEDDYALTISDEASDAAEQRFVSIGLGAKGRVLIVVYSHRATHHFSTFGGTERARAV